MDRLLFAVLVSFVLLGVATARTPAAKWDNATRPGSSKQGQHVSRALAAGNRTDVRRPVTAGHDLQLSSISRPLRNNETAVPTNSTHSSTAHHASTATTQASGDVHDSVLTKSNSSLLPNNRSTLSQSVKRTNRSARPKAGYAVALANHTQDNDLTSSGVSSQRQKHAVTGANQHNDTTSSSSSSNNTASTPTSPDLNTSTAVHQQHAVNGSRDRSMSVVHNQTHLKSNRNHGNANSRSSGAVHPSHSPKAELVNATNYGATVATSKSNSSSSYNGTVMQPSFSNITLRDKPIKAVSSGNKSSNINTKPALQQLTVGSRSKSTHKVRNMTKGNSSTGGLSQHSNVTHHAATAGVADNSSTISSIAAPQQSPAPVQFPKYNSLTSSKYKRPSGSAPGAEISTSVLIYSFSDMERTQGSDTSFCEQFVQNSKGFYAKKINFVLTVYNVWSNRTVQRFYYKDGRHTMLPATSALVDRFRAGVAHCFKAALDAGFTTIHIVPHLNTIEGQLNNRALWRNIVPFAPLGKAADSSTGSFNYHEVLLIPTAQALNSVVRNDTTVEFTLAGEQGLSTWTYARQYTQIIHELKNITSRGKDPDKHHFGVSFNYDKVCGCVEPEERDPILYNNTYIDRFKRSAYWLRYRIDAEAMKELLNTADFIGLSSYAPLPASLTFNAMETSIQTAAFEMLAFGIDLKELLFIKNKSMVYSEQGLGGTTDNYKMPPNLDYIRKYPFSGARPSYNPNLDPWQVAEFRDYRRTLYKVLSDWAKSGGGPQYRIDGIFVWSSGSWDVHGAHPSSSNSQGTYSDPVIQCYIKQANAAVNGINASTVPSKCSVFDYPVRSPKDSTSPSPQPTAVISPSTQQSPGNVPNVSLPNPQAGAAAAGAATKPRTSPNQSPAPHPAASITMPADQSVGNVSNAASPPPELPGVKAAKSQPSSTPSSGSQSAPLLHPAPDNQLGNTSDGKSSASSSSSNQWSAVAANNSTGHSSGNLTHVTSSGLISDVKPTSRPSHSMSSPSPQPSVSPNLSSDQHIGNVSTGTSPRQSLGVASVQQVPPSPGPAVLHNQSTDQASSSVLNQTADKQTSPTHSSSLRPATSPTPSTGHSVGDISSLPSLGPSTASIVTARSALSPSQAASDVPGLSALVQLANASDSLSPTALSDLPGRNSSSPDESHNVSLSVDQSDRPSITSIAVSDQPGATNASPGPSLPSKSSSAPASAVIPSPLEEPAAQPSPSASPLSVSNEPVTASQLNESTASPEPVGNPSKPIEPSKAVDSRASTQPRPPAGSIPLDDLAFNATTRPSPSAELHPSTKLNPSAEPSPSPVFSLSPGPSSKPRQASNATAHPSPKPYSQLIEPSTTSPEPAPAAQSSSLPDMPFGSTAQPSPSTQPSPPDQAFPSPYLPTHLHAKVQPNAAPISPAAKLSSVNEPVSSVVAGSLSSPSPRLSAGLSLSPRPAAATNPRIEPSLSPDSETRRSPKPGATPSSQHTFSDPLPSSKMGLGAKPSPSHTNSQSGDTSLRAASSPSPGPSAERRAY